MRANDPLVEVGFHVSSSRLEDRSWIHTLEQLAGHFGAGDPVVVCNTRLVDKRRQWRNARNVWQNAAVRTLLRWTGTTPPFDDPTTRRAAGIGTATAGPGCTILDRTGRGGPGPARGIVEHRPL